MAATTTAFSNLLQQLQTDFPALHFEAGDEFRWSASKSTVFYNPDHPNPVNLLHETAHGLLRHHTFEHDIELLRLEREAWDKAVELAATYGVSITTDHIEDALDSYRDWLHERSLCPRCHQTGFQESESRYVCAVCGQKWQVNDARHTGLKRRKIN